MKSRTARLVVVFFGSLLSGSSTAQQATRAQPDQPFSLTQPVLCQEVRGYRDFDLLKNSSVTRDDKLLLYCEPSGFTTQPLKDQKGYRAHLSSDGRIRRKGRKELLFEKKNLLDYDVTAPYPPRQIYLKTSLAIKGLPPGDYEFDMVVKDLLNETQTVTRITPFTVVAGSSAPSVPPDSPSPAPKAKPQPKRNRCAPRARTPRDNRPVFWMGSLRPLSCVCVRLGHNQGFPPDVPR